MSNKMFYKISASIIVVLIAIIVTCIVLANRNNKKLAQQDYFPAVMSSTNETEEVLTVDIPNEKNEEIAKTNEINTTKSKTEKAAGNTKKNTEEKVKETPKEPVFKYPVEGEIVVDYAKDKLVYSSTLGEWVTHLGVDIKAEKTTVVKASEEGTVKSIKNDPRYGLTVVIDHTNGFSTVYSNLLTAEFVSIGEKVKSGQTIGTVGNTASFEILDEAHLHFEILKNNEQVDPNMYLKK